MHMQAGSDFAARFLKSDRVGFYLRVLQEGALAERDDDAVTIAEFLRIYTTKSRDPATLERVLAMRHLGDAWRRYFEKRLQASQP